MVRDGLIGLLSQADDIEICGGAANSAEALELARTQNPDIIVLDMFLENDADTSDLIREMRTIRPAPRILVISMHREEDVAERVAAAGAQGFISKAETTDLLVEAIRIIKTGRRAFSPRIMARILDEPIPDEQPDTLANLTAREIQVFRLIGSGLGLSDIADRLDIRPKTVATHRENLKNKLTCHTAAELTRRSREWLGIR